MNLYLTADRVGEETGGGVVTKNELLALQTLGETHILSASEIAPIQQEMGTSPFLCDYVAHGLARELLAKSAIEFVHVYAGCFSQTLRLLKAAGARISYTAAAHDPELSRQEFVKLGIPYAYPHMTDPMLFETYVDGYRQADLVICPSSLSANLMRKFGCSNVTVIPHGVDLPAGVKPIPKRFDAAYLGQPGPDKGLLYLIQAWKKLGYDDSRLLLAGRGTEELSGLVRKEGGGNIQIMGFVKSPSEVYDACSAYCQSSVTEGFGCEVLEAMAHGRPVIVAAGAGAVEVVDDGIDGFIVPIRDPNAIADRIDRLRHDRQLMIEMGKKARAKARQFGWDDIRRQYADAWRTLCSTERAGSKGS